MSADSRVTLNCTRRSKAMNTFNFTLEDLGIIDLPLQGAKYTWFRSEDSLQASRIDRILISPEWNDNFRAIKQSALPRVFIRS